MSLQNVVSNVGFFVKKNSPYILFGVGCVAVVGAVAEAIHATTKLEPIIDDHKFAVDDTNEYYDEKEMTPELEQQKKKEIAKINRTFIWECTKLYAPTAVISLTAIAAFGGSFAILNKRYAATATALAATTEMFEAYRARVKAEEDGELKDYAYLHGLDIEEIEDTEVDENGKKKKVKKKVLTGKPDGLYSYRFEKYDPSTETGATQWDSSSVYSFPYISGCVNHRQQQLESGNYVWLSDILDDLGFGENTYGAEARIAGWAPGDIILCGLEEAGTDPMSEDAINYLYHDSADVTLVFNPRPNLFGELYDVNNTIEHATYPKLEVVK